MNIRPASTDDLSFILEVYNDAILNTTAVYEYEPFTEEYIQAWMDQKHRDHQPVLISEYEGRASGFATLGVFRSRAAYRLTAEHSVYVHPSYRGKGQGKLLLEAIEQTARHQGYHLLVGGIDAENTISIRLHEAAGFREAGRIHEAAWKFNRWLDLVFMEKIISDKRP